MKLITLLLLVTATALFAAGPTLSGESSGEGFWFPATDDIIDTYAYDENVCSSIPASFDDYRVVDDFVATGSVELTGFTYWIVTTGSVPTELLLISYADDGGTPGNELGQDSYAVTTAASGYVYAGYTVYVTNMPVSISVDAGTYWFGFYRSDGGETLYVGIGPTVTGAEAHRTVAAGYAWEPMSNSIVAADLYKTIEGNTTALDSETWGSIKGIF